MKSVYFYTVILIFLGCKKQEKELTAQQVVNKAIEAAGGERYENAEITFTFRNIVYKSIRQDETFSLQRILPDTLNTIDLLTNLGFTRIQDNEKVILADSILSRYAESVNSVHYFMQLPYGLNDEAVYKKFLGNTTINEKDYYTIEASFSKEVGGIAVEGLFLFWISTQGFTIDYLAYNFFSGERGVHFRESYNPRVVGGIRFVDYKNFRPKTGDVDFYKIAELYEKGRLTELSLIEKEKINVRLLK